MLDILANQADATDYEAQTSLERLRRKRARLIEETSIEGNFSDDNENDERGEMKRCQTGIRTRSLCVKRHRTMEMEEKTMKMK